MPSSRPLPTEFPGTPHRYCHNHFLRDVAQPVLEMDSQAKVKMRRKVRGLRAIERRVLEERRHAAAPEPPAHPGRPKRPIRRRVAIPLKRRAQPLCVERRGVPTDGALDATVWATTGKRKLRTRRERSCSGIVRRCGVFSTTARAVRFTRPVYGCVRPYKTSATRWTATCTGKKGGCRVVVEAAGRLH